MRTLAAVLLLLSAAAGCTPATLGAHAIHPAMTGDSKETWIYLHSEDSAHTGVYRCSDGAQGPVCVKAKLVK